MIDRSQLRQEACTSDDDAPRLVYADWLEAEGDLPRANLIRAQCEVARLPRWERRAAEASWEAEAILAAHGARFRSELPHLGGVEWTNFERGFPSTVRVSDPKTLRACAAVIAAAAPIYRVWLHRNAQALAPPQRKRRGWYHRTRLSADRGVHLDLRD